MVRVLVWALDQSRTVAVATVPSNAQQSVGGGPRRGETEGPSHRDVSQADHSVFLLGASVIQVHNNPLCNHRGGGEPGNIQVPPLSQADLNVCGPPQKPLKKYIQYKQKERKFKRRKDPSEGSFLFHAGDTGKEPK